MSAGASASTSTSTSTGDRGEGVRTTLRGRAAEAKAVGSVLVTQEHGPVALRPRGAALLDDGAFAWPDDDGGGGGGGGGEWEATGVLVRADLVPPARVDADGAWSTGAGGGGGGGSWLVLTDAEVRRVS